MEDAGRIIIAQRQLSAALLPESKQPIGARPQVVTRRLGKINAINISTGQCKIDLNNASFDGVRWYSSYFPRVGDLVWIEFNGGTDPIIIGTINTGTPAVAGTQDPWHYIGAAGEPAYQNAWVAYGSGWAAPAFRRVGELVVIKGLVKTGTAGSTIFNIPAGFRPNGNQMFSGEADPGAPAGSYNGTFYVSTGGDVIQLVGGTVSVGIACVYVADL